MPIYEYRCRDCGCRFETLVRGGDTATECPTCHGRRLGREMSVFAPRSGAPGEAPSPAMTAANGSGGGCCGGGICGCG